MLVKIRLLKLQRSLIKEKNSVGQRESRIVKQEHRLHSRVRSADNSPAPVSKAITHLNKVKKIVKTSAISPQLSTLNLTDTSTIDVTSISSPPKVELPLNIDTCPCGVSDKKMWKIDCSKCGRYRHTSCLSMNGISKDSIYKMVNHLCPFCHIPPAQNIGPRSKICFTCKNTDNLRSLALWQEIQLISDKINDLQTVSANLEKINETIAKDTLVQNSALSTEGKISNQEDNMKKIEDELKELAKNFEYQTKLLEDSQSKCANVFCAQTTSGLSPNSTPVRKPLPTHSASNHKLIPSEKPIADTRDGFLDVRT